MASLLDIGPLVREVEIRGHKLVVTGIGAQGVVYLLNRFPVLRAIMTGKELKNMTMDAFIALAPEAVSAVIACGLGYAGTNIEEQDKAELVASTFSIDEQVYVISEIMEVTLPRGVGPFVEMIEKLGRKGEELGKGLDMKLAVRLSSASRTATPQQQPGGTPPAS